MQNELLDIIIIGCLVALFASTYRKRATSMVRAWTVGWLLILVHFAALLCHPRNSDLQRVLDVLSLSGLVGCAVVFLLPAARADGRRGPQNRFALLGGLAAVLFALLQTWNVTSSEPYVIALSLGEAAAIAYGLRLRRVVSPVCVIALFAASAGCAAWLAWTIVHNRFDIGVSAMLTQLYLFVAITYMEQFRRFSGGTITVCAGLLAWAAVFPSAEFCAHLGIGPSITPELWNVPKYFVAFGMFLVLLEEEMQAASRASRHYQLLFEANPLPMWIADPTSGAIESVNAAAVAQYGYSREEFIGLRVSDLDSTSESRAAARSLRLDTQARQMRRDKSSFLAHVTTRQMQSEGRDLTLTLIEDITERQHLHNRLLHQAQHDLLTGLPNRALLEQTLRETLAHSERYQRKSALLCVDLDRFKQINDTYGHAVGDECLQVAARRLSSRMRSVDLVARVGGEEFAVLLHEIATIADAEAVAMDLLQALNRPLQTGGYSTELTASIGIAVYPDDAPDAARLWRNADCAMYRAKRAGGNQYLCMSPDIDAEASEANELEFLLRRALKGEPGLELEFQPLYKINGDLESMEALIRFQVPHLGRIGPDRFVPIAEETGLIVPLGEWVLRQVCARQRDWAHAGLQVVPIAINVSSRQITRPDFAESVIETLKLYGMDPRLVGLEITETAMMRNIAEATRQISQLAELGIAFSIDDFGTGYSSLAQLDRLPVQTLKIDRSFITRLCEPNGTYSIVDAIVSMAHSLGLSVVAEGVEETAQLDRLRELHCDTIQGYLLSRPVQAATVPSLLASRVTLKTLHEDRMPAWVS